MMDRKVQNRIAGKVTEIKNSIAAIVVRKVIIDCRLRQPVFLV